jgi:hypothetical protein
MGYVVWYTACYMAATWRFRRAVDQTPVPSILLKHPTNGILLAVILFLF